MNMDEEITLKLLTLNAWAIPYVSKHRTERLNAIAERLSAADYDVVCLQEVWSSEDYKMIKAKVFDKLPHTHYFYSGVVGSGICVFSRFPIQDVMFHKWSLNGYVHKIHHGDWFGGKGVGLCRLRVNEANVNVYIAHLHAEYDSINDEYMAHRVLQAFDTAQFIRMTEGGADAAILSGDLNTGPQDLAYKIIREIAGMADACSNSTDLGTNECANNSYTPSKVARTCPQGKRIDHILYLGSKRYEIHVANYEQPFPHRVPDKNFSYSDHEAVAVHLKFKKGQYQMEEHDVRDSLKAALNICDKSLRNVQRQRYWYYVACCLLIVPLIWSMGLDSSSKSIGIGIALNGARLLGSAVLCYALFMGSIWNAVERNALKAGYLAMELHLVQLNNNVAQKKS